MLELTILIALAVYPTAFTMANMHGPFGLCKVFRELVCGCFHDECKKCRWEWVTEGVQCPICWSFWMNLSLIFIFGPLVFPAWGICTLIHLGWKGWNPENRK